MSDKGMKIGMDGKRAVANNTGLGNYSRYAVNILSAAYPGSEFVLYAPDDTDNERLRPLLARDNVSLCVPALKPAWSVRKAFWRTFDLPLDLSRDNIDLYHGLSNELPLTVKGVCPTVVTIHDIIYRRFPADYGAIDRRLYDYKYSRSARMASRVIAISERTAADLVADYGIDPAKIDVVYQGVDPVFSLDITTADRQRVREKYGLPECFIISVGTVSPRKNQLLALQGLARLPQQVQLVVVGRLSGDYGRRFREAVAALGLSQRVKCLSNVPMADLPALYSCARVASYTSRYEGFGLPVVEALSCGTPVVACTGSCLEEAGGEGAVYVHPDDAVAYAEAAARLIDDTVAHDTVAGRGRRHIRRFSAENFARSTMASYRKAIIDFMS